VHAGRPAFLPYGVPPTGIVLSFRARTDDCVRVVLGADASVQDSALHPDVGKVLDGCYSVCIGCDSTTASTIRRGISGPVLASTAGAAGLAAKPAEPAWCDYWVSCDPRTGWLACGRGLPLPTVCACPCGDSAALRVRDPRPLPVRCVGLSCGRAPIHYQRLHIAPAARPSCAACAAPA
jgi:hypothetical protein